MTDLYIGTTIAFDLTPARKEDTAPQGGNGSQVLPVADLDDDYDGTPEDGLEYLFMVRREAKAHPDINRAVAYDLNPPKLGTYVPRPSTVPTDRPSEVWRAAFMIKFHNLRRRIADPPHINTFPSVIHADPPSSKNRSAWRTYIYGHKLPRVATPLITPAPTAPVNNEVSAEDPEEEMDNEGLTALEILERAKAMALASLDLDAPTPNSILRHDQSFAQLSLAPSHPSIPPIKSIEDVYDPPPHLPSVSLLIDLDDTGTILEVLDHFHEWLEERLTSYHSTQLRHASLPFRTPARVSGARVPLPTPHEGSWILSLLSSLTFLLSSSDISILRSLCRTLLSLSALSEETSVGEEDRGAKIGRTGGERRRDENEAEGRATCWMIVTVVSDVWGQKDLWNGD